MAEYIEREATCYDCLYYCLCYKVEHYGRDIGTDEPCEKFKHCDDVVEVKHGEWTETGDDTLDNLYCGWKCSKCGFVVCGDRYNYCPNCGAKMDGERKCDNDG